MEQRRSIRFGGFVLNAERGRLEDASGAERFLRPKSHRVLELLAERLDQLATKDELVQGAWPDVIVSDDSLAQCVSDIRRALGPEGAALLRTVPRRGYMLVSGTIRPEARRPSEPPAPATRRAARPIAPGLAAGLAAAALLAAALGAFATLPRNGTHTGPRPLAADDAVAQAHALLQTRDWRRRDRNDAARALLEAALERTPGDASAWTALALTYWLEVKYLAWGGGRREMAQALEMVESAVALGGAAEAHRLLAEMRLLAPFEEMRSPVDALANARAAAALAPDDPDNLAVLAHALALTGRADEAVATIERALRGDPDPPDWRREIAGLSYLLAGDAARAVELLGPLYGAGTFAHARWWAGWLFAASLAHAGRIEEAAAVVRAAHAQRPERTVSGVALSFAGLADPQGLAMVLDGLRLAGMPG